MVKNLPAVKKTWVQSLDWEDPLEKEMASHFSILTCRIPWAEEPGGLQSILMALIHIDQVFTNGAFSPLCLMASLLTSLPS